MNYIHTKTGNLYLALYTCKVKINGEWVEGMAYRRAKFDGELFVRSKEDFDKNFQKIE